jgi:outer membrane protein OmpA-like peptidoglycan-associated protein
VIWSVLLDLAHAQVTYEAVTRVQRGDAPKIFFHGSAAGSLTGEVACGAVRVPFGFQFSSGSAHEVAIPGLPEGRHACTGSLHLALPDGSTSDGPLRFEVEVRAPFSFRIGNEDWDRAARTLTLHPNEPVATATAVAIGAMGRELSRATADTSDPLAPVLAFGGVPDGEDGEIVKIEVRVQDDAGLWTDLTLSPWFYAIPHEDVVFASGSAALETGELGKLEGCWAEVKKVLDRYGSVVQISLYVAGYTDTVGAPDANRALSKARADAIARWFVRRGFPGPVRAQGFGEAALAVPTPDETDSAPNRRALYLLAAEPPPPSADLPADDWVEVR